MSKTFFTVLLLISYSYSINITYRRDTTKWKQSNSVYLLQGDSVALSTSYKKDDIAEINWYQIIPDVSKYYKNANHPHEPNPYKWVGFGKINYNEKKLTSLTNKRRITITPALLKKSKPVATPYYHSNLGSFWFRVEIISTNGDTVSSPGVETNDHRGLSPKVFRVSYMQSKSFLGYLTSYLNVPGIFGSVPYQCKHYIGVDCADVIMAAYTLQKKKTTFKDYNVAMMTRTFKTLVTDTLTYGAPRKELYWGKDFKAGDFIAVKYSPRGQYAHIGVLYKDGNDNDILDQNDIVLHAGPDALHGSYLWERGFDGMVKILENK